MGWSQAQLAAEAMISKPALNRLERLESTPRFETIIQLEEVFSREGIEIVHGPDDGYEIHIKRPVFEGMAERAIAGESVTSRGKVESAPEVKNQSTQDGQGHQEN